MAWLPASSFNVGSDWVFDPNVTQFVNGYFRLSFSGVPFPSPYRLILGQSVDSVGSEVLPARLLYVTPFPTQILVDPALIFGGQWCWYARIARYYGASLPLLVSVEYWL